MCHLITVLEKHCHNLEFLDYRILALSFLAQPLIIQVQETLKKTLPSHTNSINVFTNPIYKWNQIIIRPHSPRQYITTLYDLTILKAQLRLK